MKRNVNLKPCRNPPVSSACGPYTTISLEMMPGMFGVDTGGYEIIRFGDRQRVVPKQPSNTNPAGGGSSSGDCSCQCDFREFADDLCELFCEEEFAVCEESGS